MSGNGEGQPPTPMMMPRRRPAIPPAQHPPARSAFLAASGIPRRGIPDAVAWPDTGVLLSLGTQPDLLPMFRSHYRGRLRIASAVARELRLHSNRPAAGLPDAGYDRVTAAARAYQGLLVGPARLEPVEATDADLLEIDEVAGQLKARCESAGRRHAGEAEIIALARRHARSQQRQHVLLTNDGGASFIAGRHGLPARHFGDILAELACTQPELTPERCLSAFTQSLEVSAPPACCRPSGAGYFTCVMTEAGCPSCDAA
jgi:hypothetical protein